MSLRQRYHVFMGERYGNLSGRLLVKTAEHAASINDMLTLRRVQAIIDAGTLAGWANDEPTRKLAPNRPDPGRIKMEMT